MTPPEESIEEMEARNKAGAHEYNCEVLSTEGAAALHVAPEFAPHIRAVLTALPPDVTDRLMDLKVTFFAAGRLLGLTLDLPQTLHAHPIPDSHIDNLHTHPGGKILYLSPLLLETTREQIRFTIAHEIAHIVLEHSDEASPNADDVGQRQEREADELAARWGFERPPTVHPA